MCFIKTWSQVGVFGTAAQSNNRCSLPSPLCLGTYYSSYLQINVTHLGQSLEHVPAGRKQLCSCSIRPNPRLKNRHALLNPGNSPKHLRAKYDSTMSAHVRPYDPNYISLTLACRLQLQKSAHVTHSVCRSCRFK